MFSKLYEFEEKGARKQWVLSDGLSADPELPD